MQHKAKKTIKLYLQRRTSTFYSINRIDVVSILNSKSNVKYEIKTTTQLARQQHHNATARMIIARLNKPLKSAATLFCILSRIHRTNQWTASEVQNQRKWAQRQKWHHQHTQAERTALSTLSSPCYHLSPPRHHCHHYRHRLLSPLALSRPAAVALPALLPLFPLLLIQVTAVTTPVVVTIVTTITIVTGVWILNFSCFCQATQE